MDAELKYRAEDAWHTITVVAGQIAAICIENKTAVTWYNAGGQKHRDGDLPAVRHTLDHSGHVIEIWYQGGQISRGDDKPASIQYKDGKILSQTWFVDGREGRQGARPSSIEYMDGREIHKYFRGNKLIRDDDLPPWVVYSGGRIVEERWVERAAGLPTRIKYEECIKTHYWSGKQARKKRIWSPVFFWPEI